MLLDLVTHNRVVSSHSKLGGDSTTNELVQAILEDVFLTAMENEEFTSLWFKTSFGKQEELKRRVLIRIVQLASAESLDEKQ